VNDIQWSVMESAHADLMKMTLSTTDDEVRWFQDKEAEARRARELEERYLPFEQPRVRSLSSTLNAYLVPRHSFSPTLACAFGGLE